MSETPNVLKIHSGMGDLITDPITKTDFRPKDMSLRRSRILQTIEPFSTRPNMQDNQSTMSKLPKSLQKHEVKRFETVVTGERPENAKNKKRGI